MASTSLDISGALMTKQDRRSTKIKQALSDFGRFEGIQNAAVSAHILLGGNGFEPRSWFEFA
jgi:hypothetical protein